MNVQTLTKKLQAATQQRNLLVITNVLSVLAVVFASTVAIVRKDKVILVPTTIDQYQIQSNRIGDDYILAMTRDISQLILNRHPYDTTYFEENILRIVHPSMHERIKRTLRDDDQNNQYRAGIRNWLPQEICVVRGHDLTTEVRGQVETYVNGQKVVTRDVIQRFEWDLDGTRLWLMSSKETELADAGCIGKG